MLGVPIDEDPCQIYQTNAIAKLGIHMVTHQLLALLKQVKLLIKIFLVITYPKKVVINLELLCVYLTVLLKH